MDITIKAKCSTCTKEYTMGTQTHNYVFRNERPMVGGACPWCGNYNTWIMHPDKVEVYAPLDEGVKEIPYHENI